MFTFGEEPNSRESSGNPPSVVLHYVAAGETDEQYVHSYALSATPSIYNTIYGTLYRQDVLLDPRGYNIFAVTIPYAQNQRDTGSFHLSFSTLGGSTVIKAAREPGKVYTILGESTATKQLIGVNGDNVEGAQIVIPSLELVAHYRHPLGVITLAQIKHLARQTGKVNSDTFLTFSAGEVLFLGAAGSEGTSTETEIAYHLACSENLQNQVIDGINVLKKDGWDYLWIEWVPTAEGGTPLLVSKRIHVDRVYLRTSLSLALGFGG